MRHQQISALAAATFVVAILSGTALAADGHVTYLEAAGPGDRPMVLAGSDRGVVFVGADNEMFRAFHHSQSASDGVEQPYLWVEDIDADGRSEYVGAGSPSFVSTTTATRCGAFSTAAISTSSPTSSTTGTRKSSAEGRAR